MNQVAAQPLHVSASMFTIAEDARYSVVCIPEVTDAAIVSIICSTNSYDFSPSSAGNDMSDIVLSPMYIARVKPGDPYRIVRAGTGKHRGEVAFADNPAFCKIRPGTMSPTLDR